MITAMDGEKLADSNALAQPDRGTKPGSTVDLEVLRDGKTETLHATLGAPSRRSSVRRAPAGFGRPGVRTAGMAVESLTPRSHVNSAFRTARKGSWFATSTRTVRRRLPDLQPGDVISAGQRQSGENAERAEVGPGGVARAASAAARHA